MMLEVWVTCSSQEDFEPGGWLERRLRSLGYLRITTELPM
jgi:hypothetical protein